MPYLNIYSELLSMQYYQNLYNTAINITDGHQLLIHPPQTSTF